MRLKKFNPSFLISNYSTYTTPLKVAIVGSGPAGFYTVDKLLSSIKTPISCDIFEKLPFPHGLARYGVAPDHPEVKNVTHKFEGLMHDERVKWYGNCTLGVDFSLKDLQKAYNVVVLSYGASQDRRLNIPGEEIVGPTGDKIVPKGLWSAREFVGWYNGSPMESSKRLEKVPNLSNTDTAVIVGQGNVALDIARLLLSSPDVLRKTDITPEAVDAIASSTIKRVVLVGRRGPAQVAFTAKEVREMSSLPNTRLVMDPNYHSQVEIFKSIIEKERGKKRILQILEKQMQESQGFKSWELRFLLSPKKIFIDRDQVTGIEFTKNTLEYPDLTTLTSTSTGLIRAIPTTEVETIDTGLIVRSIGYKSVQVDQNLPFDFKRGLVPNQAGRVETTTIMPPEIAKEIKGTSFTKFLPKDIVKEKDLGKIYVSGWLKRGPTGVIASTMMDAHETASSILQDFTNGLLPSTPRDSSLTSRIVSKRSPPTIKAKDWFKLDEWERQQGKLLGKDRLKLTSWEEAKNVLKPL